VNWRAAFFVLLAGVSAEAATLTRDVVYGEAGGETLKLDICTPDGPGPFPVVVLVHGGGWGSGDKAGARR
jgi:acetyl esterase/lipase